MALLFITIIRFFLLQNQTNPPCLPIYLLLSPFKSLELVHHKSSTPSLTSAKASCVLCCARQIKHIKRSPSSPHSQSSLWHHNPTPPLFLHLDPLPLALIYNKSSAPFIASVMSTRILVCVFLFCFYGNWNKIKPSSLNWPVLDYKSSAPHLRSRGSQNHQELHLATKSNQPLLSS